MIILKGSVSGGQEAIALHHLHRRDRRYRPTAQRHFWVWVRRRRGRADSEPTASRDGWYWFQGRGSDAGLHQPTRYVR